jgi:DNA-binding FrmR family transcriptional regulator
VTLSRICILFLFSAVVLFGQLSGISQNVSLNSTVQPDEAFFSVTANTTFEMNLDTLIGILQKAGISASDLAGQGIDSGYSRESRFENRYNFEFTAAPSRMQEIAGKLNAIQQNLPDGVTQLQFSANLRASQKAINDARLRLLPDLIAEARQRAEALARLSGLNLGAIESISDFTNPYYGSFGSQGFVQTFSVLIVFSRR